MVEPKQTLTIQSVNESIRLGTCTPKGFSRVSTEGAGVGQFVIDLTLSGRLTDEVLSRKVAVGLPAILKVSSEEPRDVVSSGGSKQLIYALKDILHYGPQAHVLEHVHGTIRGWFTKPFYGWEFLKVNGTTNPERAEGNAAIFKSSVEVEALGDLDHVWGSLNWPRVPGGHVRQRLLSHSSGTTDEREQFLAFPKHEFPLVSNSMRKGDKQLHEIEVEYVSTGRPLDPMYLFRPTCEIPTLSASVFGLKFVAPEKLPININVEESKISKTVLVQECNLQTLAQYFPEITPSY